MVFDAAGRADQDLDPSQKRRYLRMNRCSTVHAEHPELLGNALKLTSHLVSKLSRWRHDEREWLLWPRQQPVCLLEYHDALDHGQREGEGLALAGVSAADQVVSIVNEVEGRRLDREERHDPTFTQSIQRQHREAEVAQCKLILRVGRASSSALILALILFVLAALAVAAVFPLLFIVVFSVLLTLLIITLAILILGTTVSILIITTLLIVTLVLVNPVAAVLVLVILHHRLGRGLSSRSPAPLSALDVRKHERFSFSGIEVFS
mmetsp:Transcript_37960/g.88838  ORF Transcript_37960/g.88838 Transcript_37960/m.88838 type:complete len:264 (-) Transcript_37960:96-887(-)